MPKAPTGTNAGLTYASAGVNLDEKDRFTESLESIMRRTHSARVIKNPGGFAGLFRLDYNERLFKRNYRDPVLVACNDSVGTKIKLAIALRKFDTIGIDCVAMSINDMIVQGAEPLFFLDYLALGKMNPRIVEQLVDGMSRACRKAGCALIGGETAEMPGFYPPGEYDLAGFIVGAVERKRLLTGKSVKPGDTLLALPSAGLHTNGYSLARKLVFEVAKLKPETYVAEVGNKIGPELLKPHLCYAPALKNILAKGWLTALAHITGGVIPGNLPRVLPAGVIAVVDLASWPVLSIYKYLAKVGNMDTDGLLESFNLGVGMILVVPPAHIAKVEADLKRRREKFFNIGRIERGDTAKARVAYSGALNL